MKLLGNKGCVHIHTHAYKYVVYDYAQICSNIFKRKRVYEEKREIIKSLKNKGFVRIHTVITWRYFKMSRVYAPASQTPS